MSLLLFLLVLIYLLRQHTLIRTELASPYLSSFALVRGNPFKPQERGASP
jgi:hypothetical protein